MIEKALLNQTIKLKDGRNLGYAEFGNVNGKSIFYFHGHGTSRLEPKMYDLENVKDNFRLIGVDRPGFGLSDFNQKHTLLSWPDDIAELADALSIDKFSVLGGSGGAPFALACAYKIPNRLISCGIVSGLGPIKLGIEDMAKNQRKELEMAQKNPKRLNFVFKLIVKFLDKLKQEPIEEVKKKLLKRGKNLPEADKKFFEDTDNCYLYMELMGESLRQGIAGPRHESILLASPWGFELGEISPDLKINSWHGKLDPNVPIRMARAMCKEIPNCEMKIYDNLGHLSPAINNIEEIITTLIS